MKSLALVVSRAEGESARSLLRAEDLLRHDLEVERRPAEVAFPIVGRPSHTFPNGRIEEAEFRKRRAPRAHRYQDRVDLPADLSRQLPRSFDVIGEVVLIRLPPELEAHGEAIGQGLLEFVPRARIVGWDRGVHGTARLRRIVRLAGSGSWRTRYRENGIELEVDLERAYFSPRLAGEHARLAAEVGAGERVLDLCCGVGPFALAIARAGRARAIVAVDQNPDAIELLRANRDRLAFSVPIETLCASIEEFLPSAGTADRVVFNLPHEGIKYVARVLATVAPGGALYYYEVTGRAERPGRPQTLCALGEPTGTFEPTEDRIVHPYSPTSDLVSYTLRRIR